MSRNQGSGGTGAVFEWPSSRANCAIRARDVISVEGGQPAREKGVRRGETGSTLEDRQGVPSCCNWWDMQALAGTWESAVN